MITRAAQLMGYAGGGKVESRFSDMDKVGIWAFEAVSFNIANGLIIGDQGKINPLGQITRAETVTVLLRLLQNADLIDVRAKV